MCVDRRRSSKREHTRQDTENKIKAWCFGHYHRSVDRTIDGIRYVNNCKGRGNTPWSQAVYYPKRITIEF
jgi:UDP-2,3-diacylglucosamine pyrophosphatase LpxH